MAFIDNGVNKFMRFLEGNDIGCNNYNRDYEWSGFLLAFLI